MRVKGMVFFMILSISAVFAAVAHGAETDGKVKVATCTDGSTLYRATDKHAGACRGHGGVSTWADGSPVKHKGSSSTYVK